MTLFPLSRHPRNVGLVMEESVRYSPNASMEWESIMPTGSAGFVKLGQEKRLFGISMYHQIHCLQQLQQAITRDIESNHKYENDHIQHCLNYLKQMFLCAASVRLEPLTDDGAGMMKTDGIGLEHSCRDWTLVRHKAEANYADWEEGDDL